MLSIDLEDFSEIDYEIYGIHSSLEDYHLAYQLNKFLGVKFKCIEEGLLIYRNKLEVLFSLYEFSDAVTDTQWRLIANKSKTEQKIGFFDQGEVITYLDNRFKKVDYFLVIDEFSDDHRLKKINEASFIITSYKIEPHNLKSKNLLIF